MARERVLEGLRVVEIGQYVAAPFAATIFADLGAQVVKVERPGGDPLRSDPVRFAAWNRGKESVQMDLATEGGHAEAIALIDEADLLVENLRPGALERLGLGPSDLRSDAAGAGHVLHQCLGQHRAGEGGAGVGAARPRPGRGTARTLHRGRPHLAPLPGGQRGRRAAGGPRRRRRAGQTHLDRLRPTRRDVAVGRPALPQRGADLPPRGTSAPHRSSDQVADPARVRHGRRSRRAW